MMGSHGEVSKNLGDINSQFHSVLRKNLSFESNKLIEQRDNFSFIGIYKNNKIMKRVLNIFRSPYKCIRNCVMIIKMINE